MFTFAAEEDGQIPEFSHVKGFKHLTLVAGSVTVQADRSGVLPSVLVCKSETGSNGDLGADYTVATIETFGEHVHGATFSIGNAVSASKELANYRLNGAAPHEGEAVTSIGCNNGVFFGDGVLNARCNGFLTGGEMAEASDLLLFIQSVCAHFHSPRN